MKTHPHQSRTLATLHDTLLPNHGLITDQVATP